MGAVSNSSTVSLLQVANAFNRVVNAQSFAVNSGNTNATVTVPDYATTVTIVCVGAGGGGCDANPPTNSYGGGGGGTTYLRRIVTPGSTIAYNVGAGGAGGTGGGNGATGGVSNVVIGGTLYESGGGFGGTTSSGSGGYPDIYGDDPWSSYGKPGELDATAGYAATTELLFKIDAGEGGVGSTGGAGKDGEVSFRWGACPIQFNRYTTGTSQTITAPADATFVVIKAWGGGGGGGANWSGAGDDGCGGGGGGFVIKRMPVTGGSTQFTYSVGAGGTAATNTGGAGGNTTVSGGATLDAGGGAGGTPLGSSAAGGIASGGDSDSEAGGSGSGTGTGGVPGRYSDLNRTEADLIHPLLTYLGNAGTDVSGPNLAGFGGSGIFDEYGNDVGEPGGSGEIRFEWYGKPKLTSYRANNFTSNVDISATPNNAAGYNGMIVETGTIDLLDLRDASFPSLNVYLSPFFTSTALSTKYGEPASATATAYLKLNTDGRLILSNPEEAALDGETPKSYRAHWLLTNASLATPQTCDEYDVRVTKTAGADPIEGSSNNTWLNLDTDRTWYVEASAYAPGPTGSDTQSNTCNVLVEVRRTDTDVVIANATVQLIATATAFYGEEP